MSDNLIEIRDLNVAFNGQVAVRNLCLDIRPGECLALVGESGSGKSVTAHSILQLLPETGTESSGSIRYRGQQLLGADPSVLRSLRGNRIAMIFQEPMTSLNPLHSIEKQIGETLLVHKGLGGKAAQQRILELLELVGIKHPAERLKAYPHQLSGGQRQRVMIAMALACEPELLIADEPTTALDVTVQRQVLLLLREKARQRGTAILLITHDMALVSQFCDRVYVMYTGAVVEEGRTVDVMHSPQHPYTRGLLSGLPEMVEPGQPLLTIPGQVPNLASLPEGCTFQERCSHAMPTCAKRPPLIAINEERKSACWLPVQELSS